MQRRESKPYTIRNVPPEVDAVLRRRAREQQRSLNEVVLDLLTLGADVADESLRRRDLSDLAGTWQRDPEFDRVIVDMDRTNLNRGA